MELFRKTEHYTTFARQLKRNAGIIPPEVVNNTY